MIGPLPSLWKEVPGKKVLFAEEVRTVLCTDGSSAVAGGGLFAVKVNAPHLTGPRAVSLRRGRVRPREGKRSAHSAGE